MSLAKGAGLVGAVLKQRLARLHGRDLGHYAAALGVRGLEVLGKFGLYFIAARTLGAAEAGLMFFCLTWVNLASAVARLGLERAMTRHIAAELAVGQACAARRTLRRGLGITLASALGWAALTAVAAGPASRHVFGQPDLAAPLLVSSLLLVSQTLVIALGAALTGLKRGALGQLISTALPPGLVLLAMLAGLRGLNDVLLAYAASCGATGLYAAVVLLRLARAMIAFPAPAGTKPLPSLLRTAAPFLAVEIAGSALVTFPLLLLAAFASPTEVGAFSMASRISSLVGTLLVSIGSIAAPRFAELHRSGAFARLAAVNRTSRLVTFACTLPAVAAMLLLPATLLALIGPRFDAASTALVVLALGQLVNCLLPLQDVALGMTGHGRVLRRLSLLQLGAGFVIGVVLIPTLGSLGAAITTAISLAIGAVGTTICSWRMVPEAWGKQARPSFL